MADGACSLGISIPDLDRNPEQCPRPGTRSGRAMCPCVHMSLSSGCLFPGLDRQAQSLKGKLELMVKVWGWSG